MFMAVTAVKASASTRDEADVRIYCPQALEMPGSACG